MSIHMHRLCIAFEVLFSLECLGPLGGIGEHQCIRTSRLAVFLAARWCKVTQQLRCICLSPHLSFYVCVYIYTFLCVYTYTYTFCFCIMFCVYVCKLMCTDSVNRYVYMEICMYTNMHLYISTFQHIHMYTYRHIYIYIYIYILLFLWGFALCRRPPLIA